MHTYWRRIAIGIVLGLLSGCRPSDVAPEGLSQPRIVFQLAKTPSDPTHFDVAGLSAAELERFEELPSEDQARVLQVFVAGGAADLPAMLGELKAIDDRLRFTPGFPASPGVRYRAAFNWSMVQLERVANLPLSIAAEFEVPLPVTEPTRITYIYPTATDLPENQLRFYLHFSAPMQRGDVYRHLHLLDSAGKEVDRAFLELGEELWDPDQQRFTLLCDPGRVKRGLQPREEFGPVLLEGGDYMLVVDANWLDATGRPLAGEMRKTIHTLPPREAPLDIKQWRLEPPAAGTNLDLVVWFPFGLDHSMLQRCLWIVDGRGRRLEGAVTVDQHETRWHFTPREPWVAGDYRLVADRVLEDSAGNSIAHAFDVDVWGPIQKEILTETVEIPFTVGDT